MTLRKEEEGQQKVDDGREKRSLTRRERPTALRYELNSRSQSRGTSGHAEEEEAGRQQAVPRRRRQDEWTYESLREIRPWVRRRPDDCKATRHGWRLIPRPDLTAFGRGEG